MSDPIPTIHGPQAVDLGLIQQIADDPMTLRGLVDSPSTLFTDLSKLSGIDEEGLERAWRAGGFAELGSLVVAALTGTLTWYP